jgi:hypothetical protein
MFLAKKMEKKLMNRREAKVSGIEGREKRCFDFCRS